MWREGSNEAGNGRNSKQGVGGVGGGRWCRRHTAFPCYLLPHLWPCVCPTTDSGLCTPFPCTPPPSHFPSVLLLSLEALGHCFPSHLPPCLPLHLPLPLFWCWQVLSPLQPRVWSMALVWLHSRRCSWDAARGRRGNKQHGAGVREGVLGP